MFRNTVGELLASAGISIDGSNPWDIQVHDDRFYSRVIKKKNLGLGEAYMDGWWDCAALDEFFCRLLSSGIEKKIRGNLSYLLRFLPDLLFNRQSRSRSLVIARRHYDLGNDLFLSFLDSRNQYSCACFDGTDDLETAQRNKLEMICRKLDLSPQDHLLDIGCGWGGLSRFAAKRYGCAVTAVNVSREQLAYAREYCAGLPVEFLDCDYRAIHGNYNKVVSVGMFEHVGNRNYRTFMRTVDRVLSADGVFLLHTIGANTSGFANDPWMCRYIFPVGMVPSAAQISTELDGLFVVEDWHNLGPHYDRTLIAWHRNFLKAWPALSGSYDRRFKRMWEYYLLSCAGAFRARSIQVWQIVMTKVGSGRLQPPCRQTTAA